jgi:tricarballylate dehydrogenase
MSDNEFDLIVVGCGAAGLSAALGFASETGSDRRVAVLESASREGRGGATRWTSSWFRITADRQLDPAFIDTMERVSDGRADLDYCRRFAAETPKTLDFLENNGVNVIFFEQPFANRNTGGGLGMPSRGGVEIVDALSDVVDRTDGVDIHYETRAVRLVQAEDGAVTGVVVSDASNSERTLTASAIVLACGGFEGSKELLAEHLGPRGRELDIIAPTLINNRGDGLAMATAAGGAVAGQFDMFHGEPVDTRSSKPDAVLYAYPFGIVVNAEARRFFDEGKDSFDSTFEELGYEIWKHQNQKAFFIGEKRMLDIPHVPDIVLTDQPPLEASTLEALADQLNLDSMALRDTVEQYNSAIGPGAFDPKIRDGKAARGITPEKSNWATPIEQAPFIAYPLTCAITFTFGGVRTDARARVVNAQGAAIPGLYAAGEVTGLYYGEYPAGTSVLRSATFGRLAGADAAASLG